MSFATSCPSCGTTFRVVRDQLKVSEGWVRCGRCGEVFCALDGLFELGRDDATTEPLAGSQGGDGASTLAVAQPHPSPAPAPSVPLAPASRPQDAPSPSAPPPWVEEPEARVQKPAPAASETLTSTAVAPAPAFGTEPGDETPAPDAPREPPQESPPLASGPRPGPLAPPAASIVADEAPPSPVPVREPVEASPPVHRVVAPPLPEDASLLRPARLHPASAADDSATSADVLDSRFFEDEGPAALVWPDRPEPEDDKDFADARFSSTLGASDFGPGVASGVAEEPSAAMPSAPMPLESEEAQPGLSQRRRREEEDTQPGFLQRARREERLRRPAVRATMAVLAALLGGLLALQLAVQQRDALAAGLPSSRPWLERWCGWTGCRLGPLRRIEDIVLDHSALADAGAGRSGYRLSLLLRNRGDASVALPAIELTLTDTTGQLVARRALLPADFPQAPALIAPRAQLALNIELDTPGQRLAGYTVETFYP